MEPYYERKRPFHSKVRTGCITCKQRKVKCDESRPHCDRCTNGGRVCGGYGSRNANQVFGHVHSAGGDPTTALLAPQPSDGGLFASAAERRSFYYFQSQASISLGGHFHRPFWGREVLQAAIHSPPIRHLVIALGAAYEEFENGTSGALQTLPREMSTRSVDFILQQCNCSIRDLASLSRQSDNYKSAETICSVLTASVLFIYIACLRKYMAEAIGHVQSAISMLKDFESQHVGTPSYPVPVSQLRALLISVLAQVRGIINDSALQEGANDMLVSDINPATVFLSVPEAHAYVERLYQNTLAFQQHTDFHQPTNPEALEAAVSRHRGLCQALDSSWSALDVLSSSLGGPSGTASPQPDKGLLILRIYHHLLAIRLRIDAFQPERRESAYDDQEAHLETILKYCEVLVGVDQGSPARPSCSSGLGYVLPLHMVAARCRNPRLRRRALHLMLASSRSEGIWDSSLAGSIVSHTLEIEEQAIGPSASDDNLVPHGKRVREVRLELRGEKTASLRYITVDDWKRGNIGTEKLIAW